MSVTETQLLLQEDDPPPLSPDDSIETQTTDDECDDYQDAVSDLQSSQQVVQGAGIDHEIEREANDQPQTSFALSNLTCDKGRDAIRYFAGDTRSSSEESNKITTSSSSFDLGCIVEYVTDETGNVDFIDVDFDDTIGEKHISKLMNKLRLNHYISVSCEGDFTVSKCKALFERDYYCEIIENSGGNLCQNYPTRLIIPIARKLQGENATRLDAADFDPKLYNEKVKKSVSSRLLTRFVAPVILFDKKFICRSGSLTVRKTAVFETARQKEAPKSLQVASCVIQQIARNLAKSLADLTTRGRKAASQLFLPSSIEKLRDIDAEIMKDLKIQHVCDLMIETRKMFKQTIRISSSEKINRSIYKDCEIEQMPYPGCKFFSKYHEANHFPEGLLFDWNRPDCNTVLKFSDDPYSIYPDINWSDYKTWDIVHLTKNYMKMLLSYLVKDSGGLLVHCISGWDRTPLFISMLRVSLWADGVIHQSLNYRDMAYLTLAYDWYLFGHDLPSRLNEKQEIMHFCFKFLDYIATDEFSITRMFHDLPPEQKRGRTFPEYEPEKRGVLKIFRSYVLFTYEELITRKLP